MDGEATLEAGTLPVASDMESMKSPPNGLRQINRLVRQCETLQERQQERESEVNRSLELQSEVAELERKHKLLKTRLKVPGVQSMRHRLGQKVTKCGVQDDVRPAQQALQKLHTNIGKQQKRQRVTAINHAYRLAGRSTFSVGEEGLLGVCLETATAGKFYEPYYVILRLEPLSVHKHTMPYFVPVDEIARNHLEKSVSDFLDEVSEYVQAFVMRRESLKLFREGFPQVDIVTSAPFDYIELKQHALERHIQVVLAYDDLKKHVPKRVNVLVAGKRDADAEDVFKIESIVQAYRSKCMVAPPYS